jgi:AGCS family alanine or glycine:cation symporter
LGAGLYLSIRIRFVQLRRLGFSFRLLTKKEYGESAKKSKGDISPFQTLTTSLAAIIGNGNIAGVCTAIAMGGPGSVFWMWLSATLGMGTKLVETVLGLKFRKTMPDGSVAGGPMYYIREGLKLTWLAGAYALFMGCKALFSIPIVQSNSIAVAMTSELGIKPWMSGLGLAFCTWLVIVGGIKTIGKVTEYLSPFMVALYVFGAFFTIITFASQLPEAFTMIFTGAFKPSAVGGGIAGVTIARAIRYGMARGTYSNEAGTGTAAVLHAAARTSEPARQGFLGSLDVFIDTLVICTLTALAVLTSGAWTHGTSTEMTANAFNSAMPQIGGLIVVASSFLFGYSSLISVSYYGKIALNYLFGPWIKRPYNWIFCLFIYIGATLEVEVAWSIGDMVNGLMAVTNLIGVLGLSGIAVAAVKTYLKNMDLSEKTNHLSGG